MHTRFSGFVVVLSLGIATAQFGGAAQACSPRQPGIFSRSTFPPDKATGVPLNARLLVRYQAEFEPFVGPDAVGPDIELRSKAGALVKTSYALIYSGTRYWDGETVAVLKPELPLAPDTVYQLSDRRNTIPCNRFQPDRPCVLGTPKAFMSFTTGDVVDNQPPSFAGLTEIATGGLDVCESGGCCGPYTARNFAATWDKASDDVSGDSVVYNLYGSDPVKPVGALLTATLVPLAIPCGGLAGSPNAIRIAGGAFHVRAVDWAGNEDGNTVIQSTQPGASGTLCTRDDAPDAGPPDTAASPGTGHDSAPAAPDLAADGAAGADSPVPDAGTPPAAPATARTGGCSVAGAGSGQPPVATALLLLALLRRRCRRR